MLRSPYGMSRTSVCHLSITLLRPIQRVALFGNILHRLIIAYGDSDKFGQKKIEGVLGDRAT